MISKSHLGYLAGIIDGEGSISIRERPSNSTVAIYIRVYGTYKPLMKYLVQLAGGSYKPRKAVCEENCSIFHVHSRKQSYRWSLFGERAVIVLEQVSPFMLEKQNLAKKAIELGHSRMTFGIIKNETAAHHQMERLGWV